MASTNFDTSGANTMTYTDSTPIPGPMYNPPGGGKPIPLSQYNAASFNDPTGKYNFNPSTGLNAQGLTSGQQAAQDYQNNTSLQTTTKSQPVQSAVNTTLANESNLQNTEMNTFQQYLAQSQQELGQEQSSITQDQSTMASLPTELGNQLSAALTQFANTGNALDTKTTALNTTNAANVNNTLAQTAQTNAQDIAQLQTLDQQQAAAETAAAQKASQDAVARINAQQSVSGSGGASGYLAALQANTEAGIMLPVTAANYGQQKNELQNYVTPLQQNQTAQQLQQQQQLYAQNISQITGLEMPLAQSLASIGITNAQQVAQLQQALVGRTLSEQVQLLSQLGIPLQAAQQLAQTLPSAVGQLSQTNQGNQFYSLVQGYQNPLPGGLPSYTSTMPGTTGNTGGTGGGGPTYQPSGTGFTPFTPFGNIQSGPTALPSNVTPSNIPSYNYTNAPATTPGASGNPTPAGAVGAPVYNNGNSTAQLMNDALNSFNQPMFDLSGPPQYTQ